MAHGTNFGRTDEKHEGDTKRPDTVQGGRRAAPASKLDWIDDFLFWSDTFPSPLIFRQWAAISAIAGALEQRVWLWSADGVIYPNLYVLLVASPGIGKNIIQEVKRIWHRAGKFKLAPDNLTKPALIDSLAAAGTTFLISSTHMLEYHSVLVAAPEFGVFLPKQDLEFLSVLNNIWDNPDNYIERRRTFNEGKELVIVRPQLNILSGVQPGYLSATMQEEAWTMGFTSRLIMVYAGEAPKIELKLRRVGSAPIVTASDNIDAGRTRLADRLGELHERHGEFMWEEDALCAADDWKNAGYPPLPTHSKLENYRARRWMQTAKLCMVSSAARGDDFVIKLGDFTRAKGWLLAAEEVMPDIFRAMTQKSDKELLDFLYSQAFMIHARTKQPLSEAALVKLLHDRCTAERIPRIIDTAEKMNMLDRMAGTNTYKVNPAHLVGME